MDLIVPGIGRHIGVETANRLFYLLSQILIVTGAMALEHAVKGRFQVAGFIALIFLYSMPFVFGFENFEFGLGGICLRGLAARPFMAGVARGAYGVHRAAFRRAHVCVGNLRLRRWPA
jgi:hypothetical protein